MPEHFEGFLRHPLTWTIGAVTSVIAVAFATLGDPVSAIAAILAVFSGQASNIFTAASIAGFTLAPVIGPEWAGTLQRIAVLFGIVVVVKILDSVWDSIKGRLLD